MHQNHDLYAKMPLSIMWQSTYFLNLEIYWNWKVFLKCQINTLIMEFQIRQKLLRKYFMKIMRTAARCRELKTVSITWNVHIQKRWLLCNINELYRNLKAVYPNINICRSTFANLLLLEVTPFVYELIIRMSNWS